MLHPHYEIPRYMKSLPGGICCFTYNHELKPGDEVYSHLVMDLGIERHRYVKIAEVIETRPSKGDWKKFDRPANYITVKIASKIEKPVRPPK